MNLIVIITFISGIFMGLPVVLLAQKVPIESASATYKPIDSKMYEETAIVNKNIDDLFSEIDEYARDVKQYHSDQAVHQGLADEDGQKAIDSQNKFDEANKKLQDLKSIGVGN